VVGDELLRGDRRRVGQEDVGEGDEPQHLFVEIGEGEVQIRLGGREAVPPEDEGREGGAGS
jgi:hypothetical protein